MSTQVIAAPSAAHTTISVVITPGQTIQFAMELGKAVFERPELAEGAKSPDLVITLEDGSVIELKDFFVAGEDDVQLPLLQLADGTQVAGGDFLASIDPSLDISTAAGPSAAVPMSGGLGEMAESVSLGIGGVERLGSLGSEGYTSSFVASNSAEIYSVAQVNALGNDSPGTSGPGAPNGGGSDGGTSPPPARQQQRNWRRRWRRQRTWQPDTSPQLYPSGFAWGRRHKRSDRVCEPAHCLWHQ